MAVFETMEAVPIDHDVPIPKRCNGKGRPLSGLGHEVRLMIVGDSMLFGTLEAASNMRSIARQAGFKVLQRKTQNGWRVWRTE